MYYKSNGNYEAFTHAKPIPGIENKSAYIVGAGIASLAAAVFLVRDAKMNPKNIHIFKELTVAGGSCDGILNPDKGYNVKWKIILNVYEIYFVLFHH